MKKTIFCLLAAVCMMASGTASAQQKPTDMTQEINIMAGLRGPVNPGTPTATYGAYYSMYNQKGLGVRAGAEFTNGNPDVASSFGVPVQFLWKFGYQTSVKSALQSGISSAAYNTVRDVLYGQKPDFERTLATFLLGLFRNMQFFAGITPGVISGMNYLYDEYMEPSTFVSRPSEFGMTADLGIGMSFQAGPLELSILPAFHYYLTGNPNNNIPASGGYRMHYSAMVSVGYMF